MTQLQHIFVQGLRFATEVQYRVKQQKAGPHGERSLPRWHRLAQRLPALEADEQNDDGMLCVIQCANLVLAQKTQLPQGLPIQGVSTPHDLKSLLQSFSALECELWPWDSRLSLEQRVLEWIQAGKVGMVQWECRAGLRWATVVGVEVEWQSNSEQPTVRALLLLDSHASAPWACGHNARVELGRVKSRDHQVMNYLTGERVNVRLRCWVGVMPVTSADGGEWGAGSV